MTEMRRVTAICNGTVIDHVPAGHALKVLRMLRISGVQSSPVSLVMNVPSSKYGAKDIIKVEDRELTQDELDRLGLIAPHARVPNRRQAEGEEKREGKKRKRGGRMRGEEEKEEGEKRTKEEKEAKKEERGGEREEEDGEEEEENEGEKKEEREEEEERRKRGREGRKKEKRREELILGGEEGRKN